MYATILFDIDGTIIDTEDVIIGALQDALVQTIGMHKTHDELLYSLGIPSDQTLKALDLTATEQKQVDKVWTELTADRQTQVHVFANMRRTLAHLQHRGIMMGIITAKTASELEHEFTWFGLNDYFDTIVTYSPDIAPKPAPDPLLRALAELPADHGRTLYIGDTVTDMQSAKAAHVDFAVATWGAHNLAGFTDADHFLTRPESILDLADMTAHV
ncbi:HAD family hydrolase [Lacticaseibacillus thailandensis]|nr:HAD family hydrolase [Lacticaseibacillus thailandensis]